VKLWLGTASLFMQGFTGIREWWVHMRIQTFPMSDMRCENETPMCHTCIPLVMDGRDKETPKHLHTPCDGWEGQRNPKASAYPL
jgi:hypothetical protein